MKQDLQKSASRIKEERVKNRLTQAELGAKIFSTQQQVTYLENGKRTLSYDIATKMSEIFNVRVEYLMGIDDFRTDIDFSRSNVLESTDYHNSLDSAFFSLLDALEIGIRVNFSDDLIKTTTVTLDKKLTETSQPITDIRQKVSYTLTSPTFKKEIGEKEFLRFKDQICKYILFLADDLQ